MYLMYFMAYKNIEIIILVTINSYFTHAILLRLFIGCNYQMT